MEVLFITHKYPPVIGGMEKQSYELINGVARAHRVHTLIYDNGTSKIWFLLTVFFRVRRILRENPSISLIHLNDGLMAVCGPLLKRLTHIPVIATLHGLDIVFPGKFFQKVIVNQFKKLDGIIAVSQATAYECLKRGFDKNRVFVVRNGVDIELSEIPQNPDFRKELEKKIGISLENKKILVSVGRCIKRKGFAWFISHIVPKLNDNAVYLHIGPPQKHLRMLRFLFSLLPRSISHKITLLFGLGMDEIYIRKALGNPEVGKKAFYLGKLPFSEMAQTLKCADLFVMPNIKVGGDAEGFGLVALEASVSGLPVLASAIEGITDAVIDGKNGFLTPSENDAVWVHKINRLLSDTDSLKKFGESAKHFTIKNFSWDKMVEGYLTVFNKYCGYQPGFAKINRYSLVASNYDYSYGYFEKADHPGIAV